MNEDIIRKEKLCEHCSFSGGSIGNGCGRYETREECQCRGCRNKLLCSIFETSIDNGCLGYLSSEEEVKRSATSNPCGDCSECRVWRECLKDPNYRTWRDNLTDFRVY